MALTLNDTIGIVPLEAITACIRLVVLDNLKILLMLVNHIIVCVRTRHIAVSCKDDGGVQSYFSTHPMVNGAYFESILAPAEKTGLLSIVAGGF